MKYVATYTVHYWADGYCSDDKFISAEKLDDLYKKIASAKFRFEYGCYDPNEWNGEKNKDDKTTNWRVYQAIQAEGAEDGQQQPLDANELSAFKRMASRAEAVHGAREAKRAAQRLAEREIAERATLAALKEKYE